MTYNEVTLFRRFMTNKGVLNQFEYLFQNHGLEKKTVEQYYDDSSAEFVIMTAFDFSKCDKTVFNYQFWEKIDQKWQYCLKMYREEGKMENAPELRCAKCGKMKPITDYHLGKNLVPHKFCKECESKVTATKVATTDTTKPIFKICAHCGKKKNIDEFYEDSKSPDGHRTYCKDCMREAQRLRYMTTPKEKTESINKMEDFTFFDFDKPNSVRDRAIDEGTAAINYKKKNGYLSFGQSESIGIARSELLKLRVRIDNITGAMHFVFNKDHGAAVTVRNSKKSICICNQQLVDFLCERLNLEKKDGSRYIIKIGKNLSNTEDFVTYCITK